MSQWVSEDYRAKRAYDITTDKVSISTIHSAKGLDYACVFLLGLDGLPSASWSEEQIRRLVYVGITRARHRLVHSLHSKNGVDLRANILPLSALGLIKGRCGCGLPRPGNLSCLDQE